MRGPFPVTLTLDQETDLQITFFSVLLWSHFCKQANKL